MEQRNHSSQFVSHFTNGLQKFGLALPEDVLPKFTSYYEELCYWDRSINLTGLRTAKDLAVLLFVDSLAGCKVLAEKPDSRIMDIGTGGGFPGIPLKLALPDLQVLLMESKAKKIAFLHNIIGKLNLSGVSVIHSRIENFHSLVLEEDKCDMAFCKGVNYEHLLPFISQILKKSGKLVVFCSKNIDNRHMKGMSVVDKISYELPFGYGKRVLSILQHE